MDIGEQVLELRYDWRYRRLGQAGPAAEPATLPHTVVPLSWQDWDPATWEDVWLYERTFVVPPGDEVPGGRWFLEFDAATGTVAPTVNGVPLGTHLGGYLPSRFDVTHALHEGVNELSVEVDSRFTVDVPPNVVDADSSVIDFWQPGGIYRAVRLRHVPDRRLADLVVEPRDVLSDARTLAATVTVIGPPVAGALVRLQLLTPAGEVLADAEEIPQTTGTEVSVAVSLVLRGLETVTLWDVEDPALYLVRASLIVDGTAAHSVTLRTGFRQAEFRREGFFLNGRRLALRGTNRHQLYPWAGFAMPDRVQRRDAEIVRNELNCLMVRCSHYPQSPAFLDACDELGLLVWEEPPGWQHLGGPAWRELACRDVEEMIRRDRHRPSIVVWGVRLNEMPDDTELWSRTEAIAKNLDPTRATSGSMHQGTRDSVDFQHDVFAYDDYTTRDVADDREPALLPPREPWPYLLAEAISQRSSPTLHYRRIDSSAVLQHQAVDYAVALDAVAADDRYSGLLAWVGFDYQTGFPGYHGIKHGGLADVFRNPKPGSAIFRSQLDPSVRPVLEAAFDWAPGEWGAGPWLPGAETTPETIAAAVLCANVERIEIRVGDADLGAVRADRGRFPHLSYPPFFVDLPVGDGPLPDLRLDGYLGDRLVISRTYSGDPAADRLALEPDDDELVADGADATRVVVRFRDRYGNARLHAIGVVELSVDGPGILVGDRLLDLTSTGGAAAVWVRSTTDRPGTVTIRATHGGRTALATLRTTTPAA